LEFFCHLFWQHTNLSKTPTDINNEDEQGQVLSGEHTEIVGYQV
jgi:hypothetical protein